MNDELLRTAREIMVAKARAQAVAWCVLACLVSLSFGACVWLFLARGETRWVWAALFWLIGGLFVAALNRLPLTVPPAVPPAGAPK